MSHVLSMAAFLGFLDAAFVMQNYEKKDAFVFFCNA